MTLLAFLLALGVLITAHEWGHYRVAVACGVKVQRFSVGFGQPLLRWKSRHPHPGQDTEFCVGLIPLGGYVKMLDEHEGEVSPSDLPMSFQRQPVWARAAIVAAGPLANVLLAVCLYAGVFWLGQYESQAMLSTPIPGSLADQSGLRSGDTVLRAGTSMDELAEVVSLDALRGWVLQQGEAAIYLEVRSQGKATSHVLRLPQLPQGVVNSDHSPWQARGLTGPWSRPVIGDVQDGSPAATAGLKRGDEVIRLDGRAVHDASALCAMVRASGQLVEPVKQEWEILRGHERMWLDVQPQQVREGTGYIGRIGAQVGEAPAQVWVQFGPLEGIRRAVEQTANVVGMTLEMLGRLLAGQASLDQLSGPLTLADYAGRSAGLGLSAYLSYLALVSVSLGVFNLLPLPMLDGGHLLYYLYEACTGHPPSTVWREAMQRVGLVVLVALMVFSLYNDVVRLGWLP